jgi:hypothetical protein
VRAGLVAAVLLIDCGGGASAPDAAIAPADGGLVPGAAIDLGGDEDPSVLVTDDGTLVVAYFSDDAGNADLFLRTSRDGVTWSAPTQVTTATDNDFYPTLIETGGHYDLSWFRASATAATVWFASTQDLTTWPAGAAVTSGSDDWVPTLAASPSGLLIVFSSNTRGATGRYELYATTSADGTTWSTPAEMSVNDTTVQDHLPALAPDGRTLAWVRCGDASPMYCLSSDAELYTATSTLGVTWSAPARVTNDSATDTFPDLYDHAIAWSTAAGAVTMPIGGGARTALPFDGYSPRVAATHTPGVYLGAWTGTGTTDAHDVYVRLFAQ